MISKSRSKCSGGGLVASRFPGWLRSPGLTHFSSKEKAASRVHDSRESRVPCCRCSWCGGRGVLLWGAIESFRGELLSNSCELQVPSVDERVFASLDAVVVQEASGTFDGERSPRLPCKNCGRRQSSDSQHQDRARGSGRLTIRPEPVSKLLVVLRDLYSGREW